MSQNKKVWLVFFHYPCCVFSHAEQSSPRRISSSPWEFCCHKQNRTIFPECLFRGTSGDRESGVWIVSSSDLSWRFELSCTYICQGSVKLPTGWWSPNLFLSTSMLLSLSVWHWCCGMNTNTNSPSHWSVWCLLWVLMMMTMMMMMESFTQISTDQPLCGPQTYNRLTHCFLYLLHGVVCSLQSSEEVIGPNCNDVTLYTCLCFQWLISIYLTIHPSILYMDGYFVWCKVKSSPCDMAPSAGQT